MLNTISSAKKFIFLPLLALFYLAIGAFALHPYLHEHQENLPEFTYQHQSYEGHHSTLLDGVAIGDEHYSCPICEFFTVNSAAGTGTVSLSNPSLPDQGVDLDWQLIYLITHRSGILIRGPPFLQFI